jgi:cell fate regulator YaaT (PSP1 superfamily)
MSAEEGATDKRGPARPPRNLAGVRLATYGRTLDADAGELRLAAGERVVIDDRRGGPRLGVVAIPSGRRASRGPVARILRRAEARDLERLAEDEARQTQALAFARERARERKLPVKFFRVELGGASERSMFYFAAEQRVDFRELVRDLAGRFPGRIELRQVGLREEAKMVGGIGSCGRELCCTTFLPSFAPVSIRMAKNQGIALNPSRVSGQCGRLKCCLVYEEAQYLEAGRGLPRPGKRVETPDGPGRVEDLDVLGGRIRVAFPDRPPVVYAAADLRPQASPSELPEPASDPGDGGDLPGD